MRQTHWHASIDNVLLYGVSAIIVINLSRILAGQMVKQNGRIGDLGRAIGAVVA